MNSDLLDEYCDNEFGHADWQMSFDPDGNRVVTFFKEARPEYLAEQEEEEEDPPAQVRMRKDLAEEGVLIPAGLSYKDYDDLQEIIYLSAEDLEGAVEFDTGEDPDSHAFCPAKLADGRVVYLIGVDLDWFPEEEI
jgi:hypothetical protein